jgi:hypothetical protein
VNDQERAWLDQQDALVAHNIRRFGVHIEFVFGERQRRETTFAYTVGLFGMGHPELLVFGVTPHVASLILNEIAGRIRNGSNVVPGTVIDLPRAGRSVVAEEVPNPGDIVFTANRHYQRPDEVSVPVLQLTWDDEAGCFPWDSEYSLSAWLQPRPGEFAA